MLTIWWRASDFIVSEAFYNSLHIRFTLQYQVGIFAGRFSMKDSLRMSERSFGFERLAIFLFFSKISLREIRRVLEAEAWQVA